MQRKSDRRREQNRQYDARRRAEKPSSKWKSSHVWRKKRAAALLDEPLCRMCAWNGRITPASVLDHVIPHRENEQVFWHGPTMPLCKPCHDGPKQRAEQDGFFEKVDASGWVERIPLTDGLPVTAAEKLVGPFRPAISVVVRERRPVDQRACVRCGAVFAPMSTTGYSLAKHCSQRCAKRAGYLRRRAYVDHNAGRACGWCRHPLPPYPDGSMGPARRYCDAQCRKRLASMIARRARSARERGATVVARVDPIRVFERAGWCCASCGKETPRSLMGRGLDAAPELDHISPCWMAGPHTYSNVQLLCRACNLAKAEREHAAWALTQRRSTYGGVGQKLGPVPFGTGVDRTRRVSFQNRGRAVAG